MKQSLNNLTRKVEDFSEILENKGHGVIQQITSSPHVLCLQCRVPGTTYYLYIGRGAQYQGFSFSKNKLLAQYRIQDKFLQFARHYWRGMKIVDIEVAKEDRALRMKGVKESIIQELVFFWRGRDLFFTNIKYLDDEIEVFRSWEGKVKEAWDDKDELDLNLLFKDLGYAQVDFGDKNKEFNIENYLNDSDKKKLERKTQKYSKKLKTIQKMKQELILLNGVEKLRRWTDRDLEEVKSVGEGRFKVSFRGLEGHFKKREYLFDKMKSWDRSRRFVKERIEKIELETIGLDNNKESYQLKEQKIIQPIWNYEKKKTAIQGHHQYIEISYHLINYGNIKCYLGRRAQENDYIRKEFGKKEDIWIHLDGYKSGHMIIKNSGINLAVTDFEILASALVELNGIRLSEISIVYTAVKNVKGVKGSPGMVTYKKEKHLKVNFESNWRQKLSIVDP